MSSGTEPGAPRAPHLPASVAKRLDDAAASAFALLDPSGRGALTRVALLRAVQRLSVQQIQASAPRIEAWVGAMAKPCTWRMMFDAVDESNTGVITQSGLGKFCRDQAEDTLREAAQADAERVAAEKHMASSAQRIQCVARGRIGRQRAVSIRRRRDSATLIQCQMRRRISLKKVRKKRQLKRRALQKAVRVEQYRKEMQAKMRLEEERYQTRSRSRRMRNSLSEEQLQKVAKKTRQRVAMHHRRLVAEKNQQREKEEKERKRRNERLMSIPGFARSSQNLKKQEIKVGQNRNSGRSKSKKPTRDSKSTSLEHGRSRAKTTQSTNSTRGNKIESIDQSVSESNPKKMDVQTTRRAKLNSKSSVSHTKTRSELTPSRMEENRAVNIPRKAGLKTKMKNDRGTVRKKQLNEGNLVRDRLTVRVYSASVAAGQDGIGFRFSIDRQITWNAFVRDVENKFGDGEIESIRHEDGTPLDSLSRLADNDRLFALRSGELWPVPSSFTEAKPERKQNKTEPALSDELIHPESPGVDIDMRPLEHSPLIGTAYDISHRSLQNQSTQQEREGKSTFEAPFLRTIVAGRPPTVIEIRANESLSVTSVGGTGRLVVRVYDNEQVLRVPEAIVFDSNAWFFLRGREAAMPTMLRFPGGYFYHFSTEGPVGVGNLSVRFVIASTFSETSGSPVSKGSVSPVRFHTVRKDTESKVQWTNGGFRAQLDASPKLTQSMKSLRPVRPMLQEADKTGIRRGLKHSQSMSLRLPSIGGGGQLGKPTHSKIIAGAPPPRAQVLPALDFAADVQGTENVVPTNTLL